MFDRRLPLLILPLCAALGACNDDDGDDDSMDSAADTMAMQMCEQEDRADEFAVNLSKMGTEHSATLVEATPAEPFRGDNAWTVMLADAAGAAVEGVTIDVRPWMPDHGHGTAVPTEVMEMGAGEYMIDPLHLQMAGYWEITLTLTTADGATDEVMFAVCVE